MSKGANFISVPIDMNLVIAWDVITEEIQIKTDCIHSKVIWAVEKDKAVGWIIIKVKNIKCAVYPRAKTVHNIS